MLARIHVSARRGKLHCLDSAKVSPAPKAYQKSSVKPSFPISTKEAQKTLSSLLTVLAADECLWCRRDCLFEDIKYTGMEERKMVRCLGRLGVQLLTVLYSTVSISKSFSVQETESPYSSPFPSPCSCLMCCSREKSSPAQVNSIFSLTLKLVAHRAAFVYLIQAWFYSWPETFSRCKAESPFLWRLCYNSASVKMYPSQYRTFTFIFPLTAFWRASLQLLPSSSAAGKQWKKLLMLALSGQSY